MVSNGRPRRKREIVLPASLVCPASLRYWPYGYVDALLCNYLEHLVSSQPEWPLGPRSTINAPDTPEWT